MRHGIFRSTTALAVVASLATPAPILAQTPDLASMSSSDITQEIIRCRLEEAARAGQGATEDPFCVAYEDGSVAQQIGEQFAEFDAAARKVTAQQLGADVDAQLFADGDAASASAEDGAAADQAQAEAPDEAEAQAEVETDAEPQADAEAVPSPEAEETADAEPTAEAVTPVEDEGETSAEGAEPTPDAPAQDVPSDAENAAQDPTSDAATAEAEAAGQAQAAETQPAGDEASQADDLAKALADQEAAGQAATNEQTEAPADEDGGTDGNSDEQPAGDAAAVTDDAATDADTSDAASADQTATEEQPAEDQATEEQAAEEQAPQAEDPEPMDSQQQADALAEDLAQGTESMAAAAGQDDGEAEVTEETVTEETARSSSEEFDTNVTGEQEKREKDDDDKSGLSNFERAALLGLGAVAIGSLLGEGEKVVSNSGDRLVVEDQGQYRIIKNDDALLRRPGSDVKTYRYSDGSTRNVVTRENGATVETVRAADGRVLRRTRTLQDGTEVVLFDDTQQSEQVQISELPQATERRSFNAGEVQADDLARALAQAQNEGVNRTFSLAQIRNIDAVRDLVPEITVNTINFETNSAVIRPDEAEELAALGNAMRDMIEKNPREVFLIEGHTDATGAANYNLALSDRRAETVALALTEYFDVPPENMVVQGYGESDLVIRTAAAERANRRAAVRRITPLLASN
ncbi:OmpA family protein [Primorskyibacter flagellatus]|uniref:Outer membrane protein OmpA n=1 Tax=Primorskyibacter flagellatus TaxID=1387277 RepID=A0A1W2DGX8_9RHOB|nr:OmpA family protein [Primorskyibacter flagellatus]SMC96771.1 Outer membrane protein OmpA [Primorskyibacter flagellatus]